MIRILKRGARLLRAHKKAILYAYFSNILIASLLFLPFVWSFERSLGSGLYRERMVERIDYDWHELNQERAEGLLWTFSPTVTGFGPFLRNLDGLAKGDLSSLHPAFLAAVALYLLLNAYLTAAAVASFALDPKGASFQEFLRNGGEFFGRFFRLSILSLFTFWMLDFWLAEPIRELIDNIVDQTLVDRTVFYFNLAGAGFTLALFWFANMVFDYAKIVTATEDRTSVFLAFLSALSFCITYVVPATVFYMLIALIGAVWMFASVAAEQWIPQSAWVGILAAIAVQQTYVAGRLAIRYLFYAAQMEFFLEREGLYRPEREPSPGPATKTESAAPSVNVDNAAQA